MAHLDVQLLAGPDASPHLERLAQLRIRVFRDFPYLYEGNMAYETEYLARYMQNPRAVVVLARDASEDGEIVGASTGMPLSDELPDFRRPFEREGFDIATIFYFGESVLLPEYRGLGMGHRFFDERERFARQRAGRFRYTVFCAVDRGPDHPARPVHYRPLDAFWEKRGYRREPRLRTTFEWPDLGQPQPTPKPLTFWIREWPDS